MKLVIFDFDGTLGDTRRTIVTTMQMTIAEMGLSDRSDDDCASKIGLPLDGCFRALYPNEREDTIQRCADVYRRIFQENLLTLKPQVFPGVRETLSALKTQGFTLTIASSRWHRSLSELTRDLEIDQYFSYLVGADDVEKAKPHTEPVLKTLSAMGVDASEALVVGDMNVDILMGVHAGARTCGVTYGNGTKKELEEAGADYIINSIDGLLAIALLHNEESDGNETDPMGRAIADYHRTGTADRLRVFSPMFDEDEIPLSTLFRSYADMPAVEREALDMVKGRTLDVGAGAGCHSLILQQRGIDVTAIDISPLSVEVMKERGVKKAYVQDFFTLGHQQTSVMSGQWYDTILMLMNGIGMVGTLARLPEFFRQLDRLLAPDGQLLCDSSDISYVYETEEGFIEYPEDMAYFGELNYQMQYKDTIGKPFPWLYIDAETLRQIAEANGYAVEIVAEGEHYDYLARVIKGQ